MNTISSAQAVRFGAVYHVDARKLAEVALTQRHFHEAGVEVDGEFAQKAALYGATGDSAFIRGEYKEVSKGAGGTESICLTWPDTEAYIKIQAETPKDIAYRGQKMLHSLIGQAMAHGRYRLIEGAKVFRDHDID